MANTRILANHVEIELALTKIADSITKQLAIFLTALTCLLLFSYLNNYSYTLYTTAKLSICMHGMIKPSI